MGQTLSAAEILPDKQKGPTFDPQYGFKNQRKERVMIATKEEMESAKIPLEDRGYCAHHYLTFNACRKKYWPMVYNCNHIKHEYLDCLYDDYIIRSKEYEREKRLLQRAQRNAAQEEKESLGE